MPNNLVRKGIVLGIIVLFIGSCVVPSITGTIVEKQGSMVNTLRGNTFYVGGSGPGNYTRIQDAINDSSNGDTVFVYDDSSPYCENIVVDKAINLIGEDRKYTIIDGGNIGSVVYVSADWVNITGFTIKNSGGSDQDSGIRSVSNFNCFSYNNIFYNYIGIYLCHCSNNNTITGNNANSNKYYGIRLSSSSNNTVTGNNANSNKYYGIILYSSSNNNTITGNNASNNEYGIRLSSSSNNTVTGNNANSNSREGICLTHSSNNMIISNNASNNNIGLFLGSSSNNPITGNNASNNNNHGITLIDSNSNIIIGNNVNSNNFYGIYLIDSSNNTITGNNVNSNNVYSIFLYYSSNSTITGNNVSNSEEGISLYYSSNSTITGNNVSNNNIGIGLFRDTNNKISDNTIAGNKQVGVSLWLWCNNNNILKNNFLNNTKDAFFFLSLSNTWNQNYWGKARLLPKPIFGIMGIIPWVNFDWHPAKEPYKI